MTSASAEPEILSSAQRWLITVTVMLGALSAALATTIINVAIPQIQGAFGMSQDHAQWLFSGTLAAVTATMMLNAWLMQSFGERNTFVAALGIFLAASVVGGLAPNAAILIACRIAQGAMAGVMMPLAMYTLFRIFPPDKRGQAMGIYGIGIVLAPVFGPTVGGMLIDAFNWRYVFFMTVPTSIIGIVAGILYMPGKEPGAQRTRLDWQGFLIMLAFMGCLLVGLSNGQREGWGSSTILRLLIAAALLLVGFLVWESRTSHPLLDLRIFSNRRFAAASAVAFTIGLGLFGFTYLVPQFAQTVQRFTPTDSGLMMMPGGLALAIVFPLAGRLGDRLPPHQPVFVGLFCFSVCAYLMSRLDVNSSFWHISLLILFSWISIGLVNPPLNAGALRSLNPELLGQGSGMINFFRQLGGAIGVNLLTVMMDRRTFFHSDALTQLQSPANPETAEFLRLTGQLLAQGGASEDLQQSGALHFLGQVISAQASAMGFQDGFMIISILFAITLIPAWAMGVVGRPEGSPLGGRPEGSPLGGRPEGSPLGGRRQQTGLPGPIVPATPAY